MEQYYYTDGKERYGPFTLEQLKERNISLETLVWKEGMADWIAAQNVSDLQSLFSSSEGFHPPMIQPNMPQTPGVKPKNWLIEAILITIFCCLPLGIVGIIHATKVDSLWNAGQRDEALKSSQDAGKWVKIGFFIGVAVYVLYFAFLFFGVLTSIGLSGFSQ